MNDEMWQFSDGGEAMRGWMSGEVRARTREQMDDAMLMALYGSLWRQVKEIRALPETEERT